MNLVLPLLTSSILFYSPQLTDGSQTSCFALKDVGPILAQSDPYGPNPHGKNPIGPDPHGDDPHDEQHDKNLPANQEKDKYKAPPDVRGDRP